MTYLFDPSIKCAILLSWAFDYYNTNDSIIQNGVDNNRKQSGQIRYLRFSYYSDNDVIFLNSLKFKLFSNKSKKYFIGNNLLLYKSLLVSLCHLPSISLRMLGKFLKINKSWKYKYLPVSKSYLKPFGSKM